MRFNRDDIIYFLGQLDKELSTRIDLIIIGGASLALAYDFTNVTRDIDLINRISPELNEAIKTAKIKSGIEISINTTNVYAAIRGMEDRLTTIDDAGFEMVTVYVPEKYDLALMKCERSEARDILDIQNLHQSDSLDSEVLFIRFKSCHLPCYAGDNDLLIDKFLDVSDTLFGEEITDLFDSRLKAFRRRL